MSSSRLRANSEVDFFRVLAGGFRAHVSADTSRMASARELPDERRGPEYEKLLDDALDRLEGLAVVISHSKT